MPQLFHRVRIQYELFSTYSVAICSITNGIFVQLYTASTLGCSSNGGEN